MKFINSDSLNSDLLKDTLKWVRTSLDCISLGAVLLGGLYELQAGYTGLLSGTPFWSTLEWRMHHNRLVPFDYLFSFGNLYLLLRIIGFL